MAAITEKQRVSLPVGAWLALLGAVLTGGGAWYATKAEAAAASAGVAELRPEVRGLDKRVQRLETVGEWQKEMLQKIDSKLDRMERRSERAR